jgi:pyruvate dehydrogenase E2 component (dihydrolipoamide acetyltransferase)
MLHPDRVTSLILIASAGLGDEINGEYIEGFITANRRKEMKNVPGMLFADPDLVNRQLIQDIMKFKRLDGVDEALRAVADKMFPEGKQADVPDLSEVKVLIPAIWGREDATIPHSHAGNLPEHARTEVLDVERVAEGA